MNDRDTEVEGLKAHIRTLKSIIIGLSEIDVRRVELAEPWRHKIIEFEDRINELEKAFCHAAGLTGKPTLTDKQMLELDLAIGDGISYKSLRTKNGL
jgi:hypothetical protein